MFFTTHLHLQTFNSYAFVFSALLTEAGSFIWSHPAVTILPVCTLSNTHLTDSSLLSAVNSRVTLCYRAGEKGFPSVAGMLELLNHPTAAPFIPIERVSILNSGWVREIS